MTRQLVIQIVFGLAAAGGLAALGIAREATWAVVAAGVFLVIYGAVIGRKPVRIGRAMRAPFPDEWRKYLKTHVRFYRALDDAEKARFEEQVQLLLAKLDFEAVQGATLDDETRLLSVAGAAVIVHHLGGWEMPTRRAVLIYPDGFDDSYDIGSDGPIAGMVHQQGPIVFSRRALTQGWNRKNPASNVSIHEWAHVVDLADGFGDGVPSIAEDVERWNEVLADELKKVRSGRSALRPYAGTNRAELFAVAVETFYGDPQKLRRKDPALYDLLVDFLRFDPLAADPDD